MAYLQVHLSTGIGWSARTACGRDIFRTPLSAPWEDFKVEAHQCQRCATSKLAALNLRRDLAKWEPEAPDAWKQADDALIAR